MNGLTLFKAAKDAPPEQVLIAEFETIDLQHGIFSAVPPYTIIRILGTPLTSGVIAALAAYGFDLFTDTDEGS